MFHSQKCNIDGKACVCVCSLFGTANSEQRTVGVGQASFHECSILKNVTFMEISEKRNLVWNSNSGHTDFCMSVSPSRLVPQKQKMLTRNSKNCCHQGERAYPTRSGDWGEPSCALDLSLGLGSPSILTCLVAHASCMVNMRDASIWPLSAPLRAWRCATGRCAPQSPATARGPRGPLPPST